MKMKRLACGYLVFQSIGAISWWALLFASTDFRSAFIPTGDSDVYILSLFVSDLLLFILLPLSVVAGLWRDRSWAWPALCVHVGAAVYAALMAVSQFFLTGGECWPGLVLMAPTLIFPAYFAYQLAPGNGDR